MNAYAELMEFLKDGEIVEGVVFGTWGDMPESAYRIFRNEPDGPPVPRDKRGIVLSFDEAKRYMDGWRFAGGYGGASCYSTYIWTNSRVIWVTQYDGSTCLDSAPRNPENIIPYMPGG